MNESDKAGEVKKQLSTLNLKHKENKQRKGKGNIQKCNVILAVPISKCVWKVFTFTWMQYETVNFPLILPQTENQ